LIAPSGIVQMLPAAVRKARRIGGGSILPSVFIETRTKPTWRHLIDSVAKPTRTSSRIIARGHRLRGASTGAPEHQHLHVGWPGDDRRSNSLTRCFAAPTNSGFVGCLEETSELKSGKCVARLHDAAAAQATRKKRGYQRYEP
jgi:hypothetical protein